MPRIEQYPGDKVALKPLGIVPQRAPGPEVYGEGFGETLTRVGVALANEADRMRAEQKRRADDLFQIETEKRFNQANMLGWWSQDRGPEDKGSKGILNRVGMEPHETLDDNMKTWDEQADMIVKEAKNPEQRAFAEQMRTRQRDRYFETAFRHASAEYEKYQTGETKALLTSSVEIAGSAAGTDGGLEVIEEQLARQADIIEQYGDRLGLYDQTSKDLARADYRSKTHLLAIQRLIGEGKDVAAQEYFDQVTEQTPLYPSGQMLASDANQVREKVRTNATEGQAYRNANSIWEEYGTKLGDTTNTPNLEIMLAKARTLAGDNPEVFKKTEAYLKDRAAVAMSQRATQQADYADTLWREYAKGTPLIALRETPAFKAVEGSVQTDIIARYDARERQQVSDARAERSGRISDLNYTQAVREANGQGLYYTVSDPAYLSTIKNRGDLVRLYSARLSDNQMERLLREWAQVQANVTGGGNVTLDREMFKAEAARAGLTYAFKSSPSTTEANNLGLVQAEVERRIAIKETANTGSTGLRRPLDVEEQRKIVQAVLSEKVTVPGAVWFLPQREIVAAMVSQDQAGRATVPMAKLNQTPIGQDMLFNMRQEIRRQPAKAGQPPPTQMRDMDIDARYGALMERAAADAIINGGEGWKAILATGVKEQK